MDVQMPVIDGYKCTHLLRHHLPYKTLVKDVPIVAMTASAIQGDREKCTKAGMDDYLPKPVTMPVLERMLVRWCLTPRLNHNSSEIEPSECSEASEHCDNASIPHIGLELEREDHSKAARRGHAGSPSPLTPRPLTTGSQPEPSPFEASAKMALHVTSPEGEKELSSELQANKLIDAAGGPSILRGNSYQHEETTGDSLTEENINKLRSESQQTR